MIKQLLIPMLILSVTIVKSQNTWVNELPLRGEPVKMITTNDGGYALLARTDFVAQTYYKTCLLKYDCDGNLQWLRKYETPVDSGHIGPSDIKQMQNGDFIIVGVAGFNNSGHAFYLHTNSIGDTLQLRFYNYINGLSFCKILLISNNKIIVLGGDVQTNLFFHIFDVSGNLINIDSNEVFSNPYYSHYSYHLFNVNVNKLLIVKYNNGISSFIYTDTLFNHLLEKNYNINGIFSTKSTYSGFVFLYPPNNIYKISSTLDSLWYRPSADFSISGFTSQSGQDITNTNDGGFVFCGRISNPFVQGIYLIKTDSLGIKQWTNNYAFVYVFNNVVSIIQAPDGGYLMFVSGLPDSANVPRMWLVKTLADGTVNIDDYNYRPDSFNVNIYPNPVNSKLNIDFQMEFTGIIEFYDINGNMFRKIEVNHQKTLIIDTPEVKAGTYLLKFKDIDENKTFTSKVIKL